MKRLLYYLIGMALCFSCTEDDLTPNESEVDYFLEPYGVSEVDACKKSFTLKKRSIFFLMIP